MFATVTTYTNGILLEDHDLERLLELRPTNLRISTSGFDADEYQRIFRNKQYPKLLRGLSKLLATNQRLQHPVGSTSSPIWTTSIGRWHTCSTTITGAA